MLHGLLIWLGLTNPSGTAYLAWSGIVANLGQLTLVGAVVTLWRKHMCHARGCWRMGKHSVEGTDWTVCRRHHPKESIRQSAPTAEQIAKDFKERK